MGTVRSKDVVVHAQEKGLTHRRSFLPDGKVGGAFVIILDPFVGTLGFDALEHALKFADQEHILVNTNQSIGSIGLYLIFDIILVLIKRYFLERNGSRLAFFSGFNNL